MFDSYNDVVTIDELADMLGINRKTARNLLPELEYRKIGRVYRISKKSVERFMSSPYNRPIAAVGKEKD